MGKVIFLLALALVLAHGCGPITPAQTAITSPPEGVPESRSAELVIVYDNNPFDTRLLTAWGFSCLIRLPTKTVLFDTGGDSVTLLHNMRELQIDPGEVDIVVLSHIHGDHVGGLGGFLEQNSAVTVYLPQSFPDSFKDEVKSLGAKLEEVAEAGELFPGVYTTGELGNGTREQALIVATSKGLVIVTGCAHPGVVNIIRVAKDIVADDRVYLVMGGFHLAGASSAQIESTVQEFRRLSVENVAPCHCSGDETRRLFKESYGEAYMESGVGKRVPLA
jgi:7,8-dihydropterin-6-yl-methyl-4-(beta-D-ribofuranosyl)aminobenzene 5'-phosphate synthase